MMQKEKKRRVGGACKGEGDGGEEVRMRGRRGGLRACYSKNATIKKLSFSFWVFGFLGF